MSEGAKTFEVVVVGGTPAGIMAAIAAARLGSSAALVEYHDHIGGMSTSGLGKSDIENKAVISGLFREFTGRVHQYYISRYGEGSKNVQLCREGYYYEPSVAEMVFNEMLNEAGVTLFLGYQIEGATTQSEKITEAAFQNRHSHETQTFRATVFIDATYEGDLYAKAGVAYRLGREGKDEFNELHAGRIFFDHNDHKFLPGSTGEADDLLPAYTYRLCLTDDPDNSVPLSKPPSGYDRNLYTPYLEDLREGRLGGPKVMREGHGYYPAHFDTILRAFSFAEIPNQKYDVNINPRALAFPFPGENRDYIEADWQQREAIFKRHREMVLGLLYFAQNDPEVAEEHRKMANAYHLPSDEFTDNDHFPWQLYVREGRRLKGQYTLTENDLNPKHAPQRSTIFADSVITGEFPIDSFPTSREKSADNSVLEGYICLLEISPYQVPLSILLPEKVGQLIVPVAASTTHVAFSTIRMEPQWMGLGQVAGTLAHLSIRQGVDVDEVPIATLQKMLLENDQVLTYFNDLDKEDPAFAAAQFWGTKGFFKTYSAHLQQPVNAETLTEWLGIYLQETGDSSTVSISVSTTISISDFTNIIGQLDHDRSLQDLGWLYPSRADQQPVLRGEVCQALFELFFQKAKQKTANA